VRGTRRDAHRRAHAAGRIAIGEGDLDTDTRRQPARAVDAAEDAVQAARDALARRDAEIQGLQTQIAYLTALPVVVRKVPRCPKTPAR
jgi:hypothetical protein